MSSFPGFSLNLPRKVDTTFNGWTNYETWNVALYIENEYQFYKAACSYVAYQNELGLPVEFDSFRQYFLDLLGTVTPDGVSYTDPALDHDELNEMLADLV